MYYLVCFSQSLQSSVMYKVKSPIRCIFKAGEVHGAAVVNTNFHTWINTIGWLCSCKDRFTHILRETVGRGERKGIGFNDFMAPSIPSLPLFFKGNKYIQLEIKFTKLSVCIQPHFFP